MDVVTPAMIRAKRRGKLACRHAAEACVRVCVPRQYRRDDVRLFATADGVKTQLT